MIRQEYQRVLGGSVKGPRGARLSMGFRDVVYFCFKTELESEGISFDPEERQKLYKALTSRRGSGGRWLRVGGRLQRTGNVPVSFDLGPIVKKSSNQLRAYKLGQAIIEKNSGVCGGVPVFKGTRIPVVQIVEQIRSGVSLEEVREDYPGLSKVALQYAAMMAQVGKAPGRPRKPLQIRRSLGAAAD
jgi:uncharacterized protein (DUF433 family)